MPNELIITIGGIICLYFIIYALYCALKIIFFFDSESSEVDIIIGIFVLTIIGAFLVYCLSSFLLYCLRNF